MSVEGLRSFLDSLAFETDTTWWLKRLSANDTQQTGSHQAGPYVPKAILYSVFPSLDDPDANITRAEFDAHIVSHDYSAHVNAIRYTSKNEARITRWGGRACPLLDPEMTGAAVAFAFGGPASEKWCRVWLSETEDEADFLQERFGTIEPGRGVVFPPMDLDISQHGCGLSKSDIPPAWLDTFPSQNDILERSLAMRPRFSTYMSDRRLVSRRDCEYELFQSAEDAMWLPSVKQGFGSLNEFLKVAQTILQRRRSRSGRSLEKHLVRIFGEEGLIENVHFDEQVETEGGRKPDFVFPSEAAYYDESFDASQLRMLAVKTTLRERWTQVPQDAERIKQKHLLTLQEGVSQKQFSEMRAKDIKLVVPKPLHRHYARSIRPELVTLAEFISEVAPSAE